MILFSLSPGLARALPSLERSATTEPSPRDLKAEAIRLQPLTGMSKRRCAAKYGMSWSVVFRWLSPRFLDETPHLRFVQFLKLHADIRAMQAQEASLRRVK